VQSRVSVSAKCWYDPFSRDEVTRVPWDGNA